MKGALLSLSLLCLLVTSAQTLYWDFETASPAMNIASGLVVSEITKGNNHGNTTLLSATSPSSGYSGSSGNNNAAAAAWTGELKTGTPGSTYFEFTLTADPQNLVKLNRISFGARSTPTGPNAYTLRSSVDGFTTDVVSGTLFPDASWAFFSHSSLPAATTIGQAITFRLYGFNGVGNDPPSGVANWRIDDLTLEVAVTASGSLPVRFASVEALQTPAGIRLHWNNRTQAEVGEYLVERSSDGKAFQLLSRLNASANNGSMAEYQWLDPMPLNGNNFYRIKAIEYSGKAVYSDIIRIATGQDRPFLSLYPNPVTGGRLGLQTGDLPAGIYVVRIFNTAAQTVSKQVFRHPGGSSTRTLELGNLRPGVYLLEIGGTVALQKQFVVQ